MTPIFAETGRIVLRPMTHDDFESLSAMLKDSEVMQSFEGPFSDEEIRAWIDENMERYRTFKLGYMLIEDKETKEVLGQAGILPPPETGSAAQLAWMLARRYWGYGYATEAVDACIAMAFGELLMDSLEAAIRPSNIRSINLALRLGMAETGQSIKYYRLKALVHDVYTLDYQAWSDSFEKPQATDEEICEENLKIR